MVRVASDERLERGLDMKRFFAGVCAAVAMGASAPATATNFTFFAYSIYAPAGNFLPTNADLLRRSITGTLTTGAPNSSGWMPITGIAGTVTLTQWLSNTFISTSTVTGVSSYNIADNLIAYDPANSWLGMYATSISLGGVSLSFSDGASCNYFDFLGRESICSDGEPAGGKPQYWYGGFAVSPAAETSGSVPEPSTWVFMLTGFGGIGLALRRRKMVVAR